jgi:hypothetical protein
LELQWVPYQVTIGTATSEATRHWNNYQLPKLLNATLNDHLRDENAQLDEVHLFPSKETIKENIKNHIVQDLIVGANGAASAVICHFI